jgi:ribosomal protein L21
MSSFKTFSKLKNFFSSIFCYVTSFYSNHKLLVNKLNDISLGTPYLDQEFSIEATVLRHISGPKVRVYKMRPKKKTRKTFGSRRRLTRVLINSISKKGTTGVSCSIKK